MGGAEIAELYANVARWLESVVRSRVRAPQPVIEDACQAAWVRLVQHRARISREGAPGWLATTAVRDALRQLRDDQCVVPLDLVEQPAESTSCSTAGRQPDVQELAEQHERLSALADLPERQQLVLWLRALGLDYAEIARFTGESPRTVNRQLHRARGRLRALVT
jgi:RNA polymerase sigma factor (sigma-70 family)